MVSSRKWIVLVTVLLTSVSVKADIVLNGQADGSVTFTRNSSNDVMCNEVIIGMGKGCMMDIGKPGGGNEQTNLTDGSNGQLLRHSSYKAFWSSLEKTFLQLYPGKWWSASGKTETLCYRRFIGIGTRTQVFGRCIQVSPKPVMCSISGSKDITIPLGSVKRTDFTGVGLPGGLLVTRNISLSCPQATSAKLTIDGNLGEPGYNGAVLQINQAAGAATGIGVQLSSNGKPIILKTALNTEPLPAGVSNIPITANFIQTKPVITSGDATTSAAYTLTYQ